MIFELKQKRKLFIFFYIQRKLIYKYSACGRARSSNDINNVNIDRLLNINDDGLLNHKKKKIISFCQSISYKVINVSHN